ncbi:MAG TPA: MFS transporter [Ktedonobacteraceae bacterium]|nr:MFS transporter [Ktedonobacteraceae bacterium]
MRPHIAARSPISQRLASPLRGTMPAAVSRATVSARSSHPWLALLSLGFGAFVAILDTSMVNVTLPMLQQSWQTDLSTVSWVLHLYNLLFAICLVPAGRLADLWGRKRLTLLGLLLFLVGSLLCGLSLSLWWLLIARAVQAVGAAFVSALGFALVQVLFPKEQRSLALGLFGSLNAIAAATGPLVGGLLVPLFGWRSIFFANVPCCLAGLISVSCFVLETKARTSHAHLDGWGLLVLLLALVSLVLAIIEGSSWGWTSPAILALFEAAVLGLVLFVMLERQHPSPLLDLRLFGSTGFRLANLATLLYSMALQGGLLLLSLYFLNARGATVLATAQATLPVTLTAFLFPHLLSLMGRRLSLRLRSLLGLGLMALGLLLLWPMTMQTTWLDTLWREALFGAGIGVCLASFPAVAL